jgi:predicted ABC-type ATPase
MVAGPNGSGKSTVIGLLRAQGVRLGAYLNADDIEAQLRACRRATMPGLVAPPAWQDRWRDFLRDLERSGRASGLADPCLASVSWATDGVTAGTAPANSYTAALIVEFAREQCLADGLSRTFETVMSHPSKVAFLRRARSRGVRTYLYFVATDAVEINIGRVALRVQRGGHHVPEDKLRQRYARSLALLPAALEAADRAFAFDNSGGAPELTAQFEAGELQLRSTHMPSWLEQAVSARSRHEPTR